ncbi:MAG: DNA-deoxyinosine glycosylase [Erysipelotrichaceae bacterium]|nr:DNA-deoxyinosine glycosylase [Erysipelotrichaceae bacterium]
MAEYKHLKHGFGPLYDKDSRILILGSFPSVASRKQNFYYGHPQNRFWKVLASLYSEEVPETVAEKKAFLLRNRIALYDVIEECDIKGSSDSSIKNVVPTDLRIITEKARIEKIFCNGHMAGRLFERYQSKETNIEMRILPSTSPANAACTLKKLTGEWAVILNDE